MRARGEADFDPLNVGDRRALADRPEVVQPGTKPIERPDDPFADKFERFDFDREIERPVQAEENPADFDPTSTADRREVAGRPEVVRPGTERMERPDDRFAKKNERFGLDEEVALSEGRSLEKPAPQEGTPPPEGRGRRTGPSRPQPGPRSGKPSKKPTPSFDYRVNEDGDYVIQLPLNAGIELFLQELDNLPNFVLPPLQYILDVNNEERRRNGLPEWNTPEEIWADTDIILPQIFPQLPDQVSWREDIIPLNLSNILEVSSPEELTGVFSPGDQVGYLGQRFNIITREEWGATPFNRNSRYEGDDKENRFLIYGEDLGSQLNSIVVHHTGAGESFNLAAAGWNELTQEERNTQIRSVQNYHMTTEGNSDISYHFVIAPDGTIYEGRDLRVRGAHVENYNTGTVGVALVGDFTNEQPTQQQFDALRGLTSTLGSSLGINCLGQHSHFNGTACPGDHIAFDNLQEELGMSSYQCYRPPTQ